MYDYLHIQFRIPRLSIQTRTRRQTLKCNVQPLLYPFHGSIVVVGDTVIVHPSTEYRGVEVLVADVSTGDLLRRRALDQ